MRTAVYLVCDRVYDPHLGLDHPNKEAQKLHKYGRPVIHLFDRSVNRFENWHAPL